MKARGTSSNLRCISKERCCGNGQDDDYDGLIDCDDDDCLGKGKCDECVTKTLDVGLEFFTRTYPSDSSACISAVFLRFSDEDIRNTTSWLAKFNWNFNGASPRTKRSVPPFDNTWVFDAEGGGVITAPSGTNYIYLGGGSGYNFGSGPTGCGGIEMELRNRTSDPQLEVTYCDLSGR
jgi:hypothetical protein